MMFTCWPTHSILHSLSRPKRLYVPWGKRQIFIAVKRWFILQSTLISNHCRICILYDSNAFISSSATWYSMIECITGGMLEKTNTVRKLLALIMSWNTLKVALVNGVLMKNAALGWFTSPLWTSKNKFTQSKNQMQTRGIPSFKPEETLLPNLRSSTKISDCTGGEF